MLRTIVRLSLALAFAAALAPRAAWAQAQTSNTNERTQDFVYGQFVPCINNGEGETVVVTGTLHEIIHFAVNDNRAAIDTFSNFSSFSGVGLTTGDTYRLTGAGHSTLNFDLDGAADTETFVNTYNLIGQGRAPNLLVREFSHITINNNGEVTSAHSDFSIECR